jgi:cytochrome b subunit of formate dehydrogenase
MIATVGARVLTITFALAVAGGAVPANAEDTEKIDSKACVTCHETGKANTRIADDLSHSIHEALACQDCHADKTTAPHANGGKPFLAGNEGCRGCHEKESADYQAHGRAAVGENADMPHCSSCHGGHDVLPSSVQRSRTNPSNLPATCGACHENLDLTTKYGILINTPVAIYSTSVHGRATKGGIYLAASCADCHSAGGSAHKILGPGDRSSSINHFNIPATCGKCHKGVESDYLLGIHGQRAAQGETDVPVCTTCHGEHGIISPSDPRSPVSRARVAQATCAPCHESALLNEKYGLPAGRLASFIDSYHGLKSKAGDTRVANCASCHGVHRILPSSDPASTVNAANLQKTCGECHSGISARLAAAPIHGVRGTGLRTKAADAVERIYIVAIVVIIGLMVVHWLLDLLAHIRKIMARRPQLIRMMPGEVWQHTFLMLTFVVLVISGFSLRFSEGWVARFFFGWEGGFQLRGTVHRVAAVMFALTVVWHIVYLSTERGRRFVADMIPSGEDFRFFWDRILHNLGRRTPPSSIQRFSYVEKAEYWALVWGTAVMIVTGIVLWFDNTFIRFLPKGVLDVALVVHYWEAWLATLAIAVWHMYSTVFSPHVYPMNTSWLTGTMPEDMYHHEHPGHLDEARRETAEILRKQVERVKAAAEDDPHGAK